MKNTTISWIVFLILGAGMWFLRYGDLLGDDHLAMLKQYGPYIFFAIYITLILYSFKDTVYQGLLCIIIPFYPFYWLFGVTDLFLTRAIVAGLLVGIGQDSADFLQLHGGQVFHSIQEFIATGGGEV